MIKIIKHGRTRHLTHWKGRCASCGCIFAASEEHTFGVVATHRLAKCPECTYTVEVHTESEKLDEKMKLMEDLKDAAAALHRATTKLAEKLK